VTMKRWTIGVISAIGLLGAFAQPPITEPLLTGAPWPTWGRDMRRSHFVDLAGPNTPAVLWFTRGGALEEPGIPGNSLWVPQHPAQGARYTRYTFYNPVTGRATGSFGPFWGQPSTPIFLNAAVFIIDNNGNFVLPPEPWEALMLSGGQYECLLFSPSPVLGYPDVFWTIRGIPAYRTSFGAFTDGFYIYPVFADNFGNITILFLAWIVVVDPNTLQVQRVIADYGGVIFDQIPSAALSSVSSNQSGSLLLLGFHNGLVVAIDTTIFDYAWFTNIPTLSDSGNGPEVPSDSVDRPIAVTSNNQTAIVCASNSGRVYGVSMADGSRQWEYRAGGAIMGGPSIGPDPNNGNDTVYIVVRHSPTQSAIHAIQASDGDRKWVHVLPNVSRCTPTIDRNGVLYLGDERGFLYAINLDNEGQPTVKWQTYLSAPIRIAPVMGEFTYNNNPTTIMYVAASNRFLYAIVDQSVLSTGISPGTGVGGLGTVPLPGGAR
jgi:outer membrane protein assembly factor BamB